MNADGTNARVLSPAGGNSQGPSFSPDGQWVAFTAYFDHFGDDHGCEIYIIRVDGTDLRRLTDNDYCDYQPRWGP
jgi:Tol biopolymer transport system component